MIRNNQGLAKELAKFYNKINLVFHAILAPPLLVFIWLYLESNAGNVLPEIHSAPITNLVSFTFPITIIGLIIIGFFFFKSGLRKISPEIELIKKTTIYWQKSVLLYAVLEVSLLLSVLGYYLTQKGVFLGTCMLVLIFFSLYKPTLMRVADHLNIKGEDKELLINCRSIERGEEKSSPIKL